jgi:hypothetical protein
MPKSIKDVRASWLQRKGNSSLCSPQQECSKTTLQPQAARPGKDMPGVGTKTRLFAVKIKEQSFPSRRAVLSQQAQGDKVDYHTRRPMGPLASWNCRATTFWTAELKCQGFSWGGPRANEDFLLQ